MQSWDLTEIDAPGGTIDPAVLMTDDGARAIAIRLDAGQELSDHQVRERAWVVVVEGEAEISSGTGARVLLLLAPWPGDGHYLDGETPR